MITITIKTDNAAFERDRPEWEVARILRKIAEDMENGRDAHVMGTNGNRCGQVTRTGKDRL